MTSSTRTKRTAKQRHIPNTSLFSKSPSRKKIGKLSSALVLSSTRKGLDIYTSKMRAKFVGKTMQMIHNLTFILIR